MKVGGGTGYTILSDIRLPILDDDAREAGVGGMGAQEQVDVEAEGARWYFGRYLGECSGQGRFTQII